MKGGIGKYTRVGIWFNVFFMLLAAIGLLVLVNLISRMPELWRRYDLTSHELNALSPQTVKILENLPADVKVYTFLRADPPYVEIVEALDIKLWQMLKQYKYYSKNKLTHGQYRVDKEYGAAKSKLNELNIKDDNNLVVIQAGEGPSARMRVLRLIPDLALVAPPRKTFGGEQPARLDVFRGEEALNGAILAVTEANKPRVGFLANHGELSPYEQAKPDGLFQFVDSLRKYGYEPQEIDLRQNPAALKEIAVLAVIGPQNSLQPEEMKALKLYLEEGGRLLLALRPMFDPELEPNFASLVEDWGLKARLGVVREPVGEQYGIVECAFLQVLEGLSPLHPITRDLRRMGVRLLVPDARGFENTGKGAEGVTLIDLATTSTRAWDDYVGGRSFFPDTGIEPVGRRVLAVAVERESKDNRPRMRAVLLGTPNLAINEYYSDTRDFMVNSISWLANRENLISIAPKPPERRFLVWNESREHFFMWTCLLGVPGSILLSWWLVWWFRRR